MDERRQRERELVLAPNEFAYVLDTTKGHINCYVGPNKTSLAQTDQPVLFDSETTRFVPVDLSDATLLFPTATSTGYVVLLNPAKTREHPTAGVSNAMSELRVGERIVIAGPTSFPLWPGQIAQVIDGHRLRSNEYLNVQIYDASAASEGWNAALGLSDEATPSFTVGDVHVIKGTDVSFFVPPTGVEVVSDERGSFVRSAVTLKRLEYCVLAGEDGRETYIRGESVVFPLPTQTFVVRNKSRCFKAIELSDTTGIHVKVIAPYTDDHGQHVEGDELFITGKSTIYFPRQEHVMIRYGDRALHHSVAIPRGQGRYVLHRVTGDIRLIKGPTMFLPDPRVEVITRRVLSDVDCQMLYPGNVSVLDFNRGLRGEVPAPVPVKESNSPKPVGRGEGFTRTYEKPRSITLDNRMDNAVKVDVWSGFAVQKVDSSGARTVVVGPESVLLEFDESLTALSLSTGSPKSDKTPLRTAYLRVSGNKVSDKFTVESADLVPVWVSLAYRVNFEGSDPNIWFAVDDYVRLLCDHAASLVKAAAKMLPIRDLHRQMAQVVRDAVLGSKNKDGVRAPRLFEENAMLVYDVEVLDVEIEEEEVADLLHAVRTQAIERAVNVLACEQELQDETRLNVVERKLLQEQHRTRALEFELAQAVEANLHVAAGQQAERKAALVAMHREAEVADMQIQEKLIERRLAVKRQIYLQGFEEDTQRQALRLEDLEARGAAARQHAEAFSPHLAHAIHRMADEELIKNIAENFGELAAIEGQGLLKTAQKFMDFVPLNVMPTLQVAATTGDAE